MRIGIFGGSFDPVHNEHVRLAHETIEGLQLDRLLIIPAHTPPHKPDRVLSSNQDRLEMCRLGFAKVNGAVVCDYEINNGGTSYTYLTCRHFRTLYPDAEIFWLVGTDMLRDFPTWKNPTSILNDVTLAVCGRNEKEGWWEKEEEDFYRLFGKKFVRVDCNGADVSSTKIRALAGAGMRLTDFVDEKVAEYIEKNGLYSIPNAKEALALEKQARKEHSARVAWLAAARASKLKISEHKAITAALFHDCAKNLSPDSPYLKGFILPIEWGEVPASVWHQFAGAYVAEHSFGIEDEDILNAIRYHTSGRPNMSPLEKLIFLADMLEEERSYDCVDVLRGLFHKGKDLNVCLETALYETLRFLKEKNADVYPLTEQAYAYIKEENKTMGDNYGTGNQ